MNNKNEKIGELMLGKVPLFISKNFQTSINIISNLKKFKI